MAINLLYVKSDCDLFLLKNRLYFYSNGDFNEK